MNETAWRLARSGLLRRLFGKSDIAREGIMKSFELALRGPTFTIPGHIMGEFNGFLGSRWLIDNLTAIVVRGIS